MSPWMKHLKEYREKHGGSLRDAMKNAKESYQRGSPSKTHPGLEDFMARKGSRSKTHKGLDYESESDEEGGAVGDIPIVPSSIPSFGNTNLGIMNVPQAHSRYKVVNVGSRVRGKGIIDEIGNQNFIGQKYNQKNLGSNGVVRL